MTREQKVSLNSKKEIVIRLREQYRLSKSKTFRQQIIESLVVATGYKRKYAITLLNSTGPYMEPKPRGRGQLYDNNVKKALLTIWNACNRICSKRLVPFIPSMIEVLERTGHLFLSTEVRDKLFTISTSSVDRILKSEREHIRGKSHSTTSPGQLLKNQIKVRTFADWDDVIPGFLEADLVAHCGGDPGGSFINTLTLTDIDSTWTECLPLLYRSANNVVKSLAITIDLLPFKMLGIDSDNGSEFINYALVKFCENNSITFTRSRAYKKNDQAHVEERNGSIVRRLVGYDRFEGTKSWQALTELYAEVRLYVNFFQPSLKLISKSREGAKVTKKYDTATTPHHRLLQSSSISEEIKESLNQQYSLLDPVALLSKIKAKQKELWQLGYKIDINTLMNEEPVVSTAPENIVEIDKYKTNKKIRKNHPERNYRTRLDPFADVREEIELRLQLKPSASATMLLEELEENYPGKFNKKQVRTLQRIVAKWREEQMFNDIASKVNHVNIDSEQALFIDKVLRGNMGLER